jgi:putative NIF3 family GTP cyclohydrolase 1 type 2
MVTGDISYSVVTEELPLGITMIDAGHYATEILAVDAFFDILKEHFGIEAIKHYGKDPKKIIIRQEEL